MPLSPSSLSPSAPPHATATTPAAGLLAVRIWRTEGAQENAKAGAASASAASPAGAFQNYQVPRQANQTVLDVVTHVQRHLDASLAYRFACRVGMCGSCAMTVNGVARWTCRTHVSTVVQPGGALELAPLSHLPQVKDLVVDMAPFFDKWAKAGGQFQGKATRYQTAARVKPESAQRQAANAGIECIGCVVCYASCDVVAWSPDYLGPAALNRAWTLVNDERDQVQTQRLHALAGDAGCHACHSLGACSLRCPKHLEPTAAIAGLKRMAK